MGDLILFAFLPESNETFASILFEEKDLLSLWDEVTSLDLPFVDDR